MERHGIRIDDDVVAIERDRGWLQIGELDAIYELVGGRSYTIEYDDRQAAASWLDTDDGELTFDVRESIASMQFGEAFAETLGKTPLGEHGPSGHPLRTEVFVDHVTEIWESKGNPSTGAGT